jgi:hypothetical protein
MHGMRRSAGISEAARVTSAALVLAEDKASETE